MNKHFPGNHNHISTIYIIHAKVCIRWVGSVSASRMKCMYDVNETRKPYHNWVPLNGCMGVKSEAIPLGGCPLISSCSWKVLSISRKGYSVNALHNVKPRFPVLGKSSDGSYG